jgi:hypothetical protein
VNATTRCTCARSWGLHSRDCALYAPCQELAASDSTPTVLACIRCGDEDGPFTPSRLCENCARVVTP